MNYIIRTKKILLPVLVLLASTLGAASTHVGKASAACTALPTDRGTVTSTITVPTAATYRVWTRIKTATSTNNSIYMQIDQTSCNLVVGGSTLAANTWTWVDYQNGTSTSKINATLTAGSHTIIMAGKADNVMVDRVILTQDTACTPTGTGDNCANPPDTTAPVVSITSPANNATISAATQVAATATDDVAVAKVEFYIDGVLVGTDTNSTYNFTITPSAYSIGTHTLVAKAYDTAPSPGPNTASSSTVNFVIPDQTAPTVSLTAPTAGATVSGTTTLSATAADNVGVSRVDFFVDGGTTAIGTDNLSPFSTSYTTTGLSNGSHTFTAKAFDAAGNSTTSAGVAATVNNVSCSTDTTAPTVSISHPTAAEVMSGTAYAVTASATDAVCGVKQVTFYVDNVAKTADTTSPFTYTLDTTTLTNGSHTFKAVAIDNATTPNSATSAVVTATVTNTVYDVADINKDGKVDILDIALLAGTQFPRTGTSTALGRADMNADGTVDFRDIAILAGTKFPR